MLTLERRGISRRALLSQAAAVGAVAVAGPGFIAAPDAAWAMETKAVDPKAMATLLQIARDIYPHDHVADRFYAVAIRGHDDAAAENPAHKALIEGGVAGLDALAEAEGAAGYAAVGWETDRVALLRKIEDGAFFQTVRGGLVVSLYNQKELWPLFGYEGESFSQGGYIDRGFDDIAWL
ncbi:Twin-arginine translocation pathway signal [Rubrimonas cliftonensis]|uniref:Tat (Twin-arginine translocation) pathway signal sequence n=1 Tax=Rubrimonas cliftonensis TaxID=89524 RepID=A0A1H3VKS5_9RHOB|nr:Twin-arginine translocation pathway signal [Rubrimonas cliftonensis]SDZ75386.1 hypothetical protein SAMN05444370_101176 [Rubrimonas cliftonensis]